MVSIRNFMVWKSTVPLLQSKSQSKQVVRYKQMMMKKADNKREITVYAVCLCLTAAAFFASLLVGRYPISLRQIAAVLTGQETDEMARSVFLQLRFPRTVMALIAGVGLSIAGSIYQSIFKNSLAAPDLIGVSSGAVAGAAFSIVCLNSGVAGAAGGAFVGGILAVSASVLLAGLTRRKSAADFIIAGIAVKALADAFLMSMKYLADPERQLASIDYWSMGSFANVTAEKMVLTVPLVLIALLGLFLLRWQINLLTLEDDEARMLGVPVQLMRCVILGLTTLMVASIVSVTGSISFIGLIAPHIARMLLKRGGISSALLGGLAGGFIILIADILARSLAGSEIPVSILTSAVGVPVLIWLLCRKEA